MSGSPGGFLAVALETHHQEAASAEEFRRRVCLGVSEEAGQYRQASAAPSTAAARRCDVPTSYLPQARFLCSSVLSRSSLPFRKSPLPLAFSLQNVIVSDIVLFAVLAASVRLLGCKSSAKALLRSRC